MGKKNKSENTDAVESVAAAMQANVRAANAVMTASMQLYVTWMRNVMNAMAPPPDREEDAK